MATHEKARRNYPAGLMFISSRIGRTGSEVLERAGGGAAITAGLELVCDPLTIGRRLQPGALDSRDVQEHILAASLRLNEAKTLGRVEPFYGALGHGRSPSQSCRAQYAATVAVDAVDRQPRETGQSGRSDSRLNVAQGQMHCQSAIGVRAEKSASFLRRAQCEKLPDLARFVAIQRCSGGFSSSERKRSTSFARVEKLVTSRMRIT